MTSYPIKLLTTTAVPDAPVGFRSVRLGWKTKRDGTAPLSPTKYVHVPSIQPQMLGIDVQNEDKQLNGYILGLLYEAQDKFIHTLVSASIENGQPLSELYDNQIALDALIADSVASVRGAGKISGEMIVNWFASELHDNLAIWVMQQKPDAVDDEVKKMVANYEGFYKKFASPAFGVQSIVAGKLKNVLELSENKDNVVYRMLDKKLTDMMVEKTAEDFGL